MRLSIKDPADANPLSLCGHAIIVKSDQVNKATLTAHHYGLSTSIHSKNDIENSYSTRNIWFLTGDTKKGDEMKKGMLVIVLFILIFGMSGCFTSSFNPLGDEDYIVFENEDQTVRLEIAFSTGTNVGRLSVSMNDQTYSYVVEYFIPREMLKVYIAAPELEESIFYLDVSFLQKNLFQLDYDMMYLKERMQSAGNPEHDALSGFDIELNRIYDQSVYPLNYFHNKWGSEVNNLVFVNDDLDYFYGHSIRGTLDEEDVWISFLNESFTIWSKIDLSIKLSGTFSFDGLDLVLEPFEWYSSYPQEIHLSFETLEST